ncbi:MAG: FAD-dependent oxidoreductase, partial [Spirochaetota bacterium]|nr:FAD-dependent oxidoreductase [Spirochaetota bacterium]
MKDLTIIGAGPAGLSASIYGIRAGLDLLVLEKLSPGGQVINTYEVENYPGFVDPVSGWELVSAMENQAKRLGVEIKMGEVKEINQVVNEKYFKLVLSNNEELNSKTVIIASGASYKKLGAPGENEFT